MVHNCIGKSPAYQVLSCMEVNLHLIHHVLLLIELHLVHTLTSVPVKEGLATEHASELLGDTLPELLDGGGVTNEDGSHLETLGGDVADGGLDVVGDSSEGRPCD